MKTIVACLLGLNIAFLVVNVLMVQSLDQARYQLSTLQAELRLTKNALIVEQARVADKDSLLKNQAQDLHAAQEGLSQERGRFLAMAETRDEAVASSTEDVTLRPQPALIPRLTHEEIAVLQAKRSAMPLALGVIAEAGRLFELDADMILTDPALNPLKRELNPSERLQLTKLVNDYKFFRMTSPRERVKRFVQPEIERMREAGAFIEYASDGPPPHIEGFHVTHAEPSDTPGLKRLYVFPEEDYPDLLHQYRVEWERTLETVVNIYELINGPVVTAAE